MRERAGVRAKRPRGFIGDDLLAMVFARVKRIAPSPGLRPPSPPRRGARDTMQASARPRNGFGQLKAQRRKPRVAPSPARRLAGNRAGVNAGEGWGEGETAAGFLQQRHALRSRKSLPHPPSRHPFNLCTSLSTPIDTSVSSSSRVPAALVIAAPGPGGCGLAT